MKSIATRESKCLSFAGSLRKLFLRNPAVLVALLTLAVYLSTFTANYYWDGLAFALRIERVARHAHKANLLFHRNHLIYNAVGYLLYLMPRSLGLSIRALTMLQIASALSCAIGVGFFFRIAQRISGSLYVASVGSGVLAVSTCWWKAATDADAYSLSVTLILICAGVLLGANPRWHLAGAALAGAMLIHELASLFYPAAIVSIFLSRRIEKKLKFALKLSLIAWGITIIAYYACASLVFGITAPLDVVKWAGSNPYGVSFSNPLETLATFPKYQLDLIFGHGFKAFGRHGGPAELSFAIVGLIPASISAFMLTRRVGIKQITKSIRRAGWEGNDLWRQTMPVLLAWIGAYVLFLLAWEPYLLYYRVYYVPAVVLIFVLMLSNHHWRTGSSPSGASAFAVIALAFFNLAFFIGPYMHGDSNSLIAAAKQANMKWNEHTVVYLTGPSAADGAFQYFNDKTEWRRVSPKALMRLDDEIEQIYNRGGNVWLNDDAVKSVKPEWLTKRARGEEITVELGDEFCRYVQLLPAR